MTARPLSTDANGFTIGLYGTAHPHARMLLRTFQHLDEVAAIHLCDPEPGRAEALRAEMGEKVVGTHDDLDSLLADDSVGAVVVLLPTREVPSTLVAIGKTGRPILCEKPMARTRDEAEAALRAVEEAGSWVTVLYPWRYNPICRDIRRWIEEGLIGRPVHFECRLLASQVQMRDPSCWLFDRKQAGGGILTWLGCHHLDIIRFLLQDEFAYVTGFAETLSGEPIDVEDMVTLAVRMRGGSIGTLNFGYVLTTGPPGYEGGTYDNYLSIDGTEGRICWSIQRTRNVVQVVGSREHWPDERERTIAYELEPAPAYQGAYGRQFARDFVRAAAGYGRPPNNGWDAVAALALIEAAYRSAATGHRQWVLQ